MPNLVLVRLKRASQGYALALRERAAVVWGIIGILCMVFFAKVRISSFSTVDGCFNLNLSGWGEGASEGSAFALRERVGVVWGIIGILCMFFFAKVRISSFSTLDGRLKLNLSGWG